MRWKWENAVALPVSQMTVSAAAEWVGLDGYNPPKIHPTVEQTGVTTTCEAGVEHYSVWYQMWRKKAHNYKPNIVATAGDKIELSTVTAKNGKYVLSADDTTTGAKGSVTKPHGYGLNASAECITEAMGGYSLPTGTVMWKDCYVDNDQSIPLQGISINLKDSTGEVRSSNKRILRAGFTTTIN